MSIARTADGLEGAILIDAEGATVIANAPSRAMLFLVDTGATTWNVPFDWTNANSVECIGGGGGGSGGSGGAPYVGFGGEGGHYALSENVTLTPGATVNIAIGAGGAGAPGPTTGGAGGNTWFGGTSLATSLCGAVGGAGAVVSGPDATTPTTNDVGNVVVYQGGFGRGTSGGQSSGANAGGGAAGPGGPGGGGGGAPGGGGGGGGGAGNTGGGGGIGNNGVVQGGVGGTAGDGTPGGVSAGAGLNGSGGGGGSNSNSPGGAGGAGVDSSWDATHGPGGGGAGGSTGSSAAYGGAGGLYGGAGGGGGYAAGPGGNGEQGIIVVKYASNGVVRSTWSASDAATGGMTLSNSGLTFTSPRTPGTIRTTISRNSGKLYIEFLAEYTANGYVYYGFTNAGINIAAIIGLTAIGGSVTWNTNYGTGGGFTSNFTTAVVAGPTTVVSLAIDFSAGGVWIAFDNVWQGSGSNPATGSNPILSFTPSLAGDLFAAISDTNAGGSWTLQPTAASQKYALPSGFSAWDAR